MGVEFNWQVDLEKEWQEPAPPAPPRRHIPRWVMAAVLAILLLGIGLATGRIWWAVRQGQEQLKHDLASVANLEARALRDRDRATYLWLQDQQDTTWYARQKARLPTWGGETVPEPGQAGDLAVLDAALAPGGEQAWAEVAWELEDGVYRRAQFYRLVDGRWVRTSPDGEYFGPQEVYRTEHFAFKYYDRDRSTINWLAGQLEAWHAQVCADLDCNDGPPISVLVTPQGESSATYRPPQGLTLRSPRLRGVRADGALLLDERAELASMLAYLLVVRAGGDLDPARQPYLLLEFVNWEVRRLGLADEETPRTPVLDFAMQAYGLERVRALLAAMGQTPSEQEALRLALGISLRDVEGVFDSHLAARLGFERQMLEWGEAELVGPTSAPLARGLFDGLLADVEGAWRSEMVAAFSGWRPDYHPLVSPSTKPRVERWARLDDTSVWAEVAYADADGASSEVGPLRRIEFFRQVDGAWRHTRPNPLFLGEETILHSQHFRLVCHRREVDWMASELLRLEAFYQKIAQTAAVDLAPEERLTIHIVASATWSSLWLYPDVTEWSIPSPYFIGWHAEQGQGYLVNWLAPSLLARLAFSAAGMEHPAGVFPSTRQLWMVSLLSAWGQAILGPDAPQVVSWAPPVDLDFLATQPKSLDSLSALGRATFGSEPASYAWAADDWDLLYQQVFSVMHYIGEAYGREALLSLLQSLPEAESLESWLGLVLNVDLKTLEAGWGTWLEQAGNG